MLDDELTSGEADDWSFDVADAAPDTSTVGSSLDPDEVARLQAQHEADKEREEDTRTEAQREADELGRQRRQNVRVNVKLPVVVSIDGHPSTPARSRDLSATGVGFATRLPLDVDATGLVTVEFQSWKFTKQFTVRFVKPILAGRIVGVQFDALSEDERERVVKEVFAVQRAQLQEQRAKHKPMAGD